MLVPPTSGTSSARLGDGAAFAHGDLHVEGAAPRGEHDERVGAGVQWDGGAEELGFDGGAVDLELRAFGVGRKGDGERGDALSHFFELGDDDRSTSSVVMPERMRPEARWYSSIASTSRPRFSLAKPRW